jgi:hypothetical protein
VYGDEGRDDAVKSGFFQDRSMRLFWTPRLRIWGFLALIAIAAVLLAFIRPTPRGKLRIAKLKHAGDWTVTSQVIPKRGR